MRPSERLGGHILQGHGDGVAEVIEVEEDGFARRLRAGLGPELIRYAVERGSIGLNGVSLTVSALGEDWLEVSLIPETLERTTLGAASKGSRLNIECDIVAKYVERLMAPFAGKENA
jgi:riboflavin synthase